MSALLTSNLHKIKNLAIDCRGTEVKFGGRSLRLSAKQFKLLKYFAENPGATLSRDELLCKVWGYQASMRTRTVDVHVSQLRQKLEDDPKNPRLIVTVAGIGYRFSPLVISPRGLQQ